MAPNNRDSDDEELDLINAEFESIVSGLNLDQAHPKTYLDELEAMGAAENRDLYNVPRMRRGIHGSVHTILATISRWWKRQDDSDSDGAIL